ncbi:MAG: hypothetical protein HY652_14145 [Acidobacteria bacterium]|nr:hypothetical protein [Acidobacteriota bacterium]
MRPPAAELFPVEKLVQVMIETPVPRIAERTVALLNKGVSEDEIFRAATLICAELEPTPGDLLNYSLALHAPLAIQARKQLLPYLSPSDRKIAVVQAVAESNDCARKLQPSSALPATVAGSEQSHLEALREALVSGDIEKARIYCQSLFQQWPAERLWARLAGLAMEGLYEHALIAVGHFLRARDDFDRLENQALAAWVSAQLTRPVEVFRDQGWFLSLNARERLPLDLLASAPSSRQKWLPSEQVRQALLDGTPLTDEERVSKGLTPSLHLCLQKKRMDPVVENLRQLLCWGISLRCLSDAASLAAADLMIQGKGEWDIVWVHAATTFHALRRVVPLLDENEALLSTILGTLWVSGFHLGFGQGSLKPRMPEANGSTSDPREILADLEDAMEVRDSASATELATAYLRGGAPPTDLKRLLARKAACNHSAHIVKYTQAELEEYERSTTPDRWLHLVAAARYQARWVAQRDPFYLQAVEVLGRRRD